MPIQARRRCGATDTHFPHRDHLGSPELITNSTGTEVVKLSFGAFGERRDRDWHGAVSSADMTAIGTSTRRGFTEHEHLDSVGLIHMNGRVYDPVLAWFLSSDPIEDGLGRPGGFNRYAYVSNRPLTLVDPSGYGSRATRLPKHDAGPLGPLFEPQNWSFGSDDDYEGRNYGLSEIEVIASRLSNWPMFVRFYGFGSTGATGGNGEWFRQARGGPAERGPDPVPGNEPTTDSQPQDDQARPSCADAEPQSAEATLTAAQAAAAVAARNQVPPSGPAPERSAIDPVTAARIGPMQRIADNMDWERVVRFGGRTLAFLAAYDVFTGFASGGSDGMYAAADVVIGAGLATAFSAPGVAASAVFSAFGGSKAAVEAAKQAMGACSAP